MFELPNPPIRRQKSDPQYRPRAWAIFEWIIGITALLFIVIGFIIQLTWRG